MRQVIFIYIIFATILIVNSRFISRIEIEDYNDDEYYNYEYYRIFKGHKPNIIFDLNECDPKNNTGCPKGLICIVNNHGKPECYEDSFDYIE
uniref:Uncharacterized protein n=1 Tax=Lepeophtheirus salmonis TaxID=72036 RepID=A0A0K2UAA1_LEPSM